MTPPKSCMVCGDKALGYNFNAVTCESCKAFFRRNALTSKQFTCPFSQKCDITVVTRRFCQKCRLQKCRDIGMKSENIMSEEDKLIKRRKIENNRAKRKNVESATDGNGSKIEPGQMVAADSSGIASEAYDSQSCNSFDSERTETRSEAKAAATASCLSPTSEASSDAMTGAEIVDYIVGDPDRSTEAISKIMRSPTEALSTLEKIINSPSDALRLISHLISYPGDALKIISKIMNSPFDALTVFTKFMSSPTDALEIISKIVSSPQDVLSFVRQLMQSPEDAVDIMNKFMNSPAEALKIINRMVNSSHLPLPQTAEDCTFPSSILSSPTPQTTLGDSDTLIHSMLIKSPDPANSTIPFSASPHIVNASVAAPNVLQCSSIQDELCTTSAGVLSSSAQIIAAENYDISNFMLEDTNKMDDDIGSLESVLSKVIRIEYEALKEFPTITCTKPEQNKIKVMNVASDVKQIQQPVCAPSSLSSGRELNEAELLKLRELKTASEALYYPVDEDLNELVTDAVGIKTEGTSQDPKLLQVINLTAVAIKRLIKMAKKISAFRDLCQEDQVAVLKGGCTEMMIMRSVMTYDDNRNTWKIPHTKEDMSNIRADVLKLAKGNVYEEHLQFIRTFDEKWRLDENIILIMCAIVLLTPTRPRIVHSDVIRMEQNSYYYLLRRYLESVYVGCEAKSAYIKLIQKISDVERLNQFMIGVYLNVNPAQVEPLLREIFDIKNH